MWGWFVSRFLGAPAVVSEANAAIGTPDPSKPAVPAPERTSEHAVMSSARGLPRASELRRLAVLQARLVHEAQRDLVYTNTSIKRLASNLGFEDEGYFGRFFRKHTGLTPREFRARALGSFNAVAEGNAEAPSA